MHKTYTLPEEDYNKIINDKEHYRKQCESLNKEIIKLEQEIEYMTTEKEDVLLVVKDKDKKDEYYLKSKEKEVLKQLIVINKEITDENKAYIDNINELKKTLELYLNENTVLETTSFDLKGKLDDKIKEIQEKDEYIEKLNKRGLWRRIFNLEPKDLDI